MGNEFWWFFDALVIAVIIAFIYIGAKKGFAKKISVIVGYILALGIAFFGSRVIAPQIYDSAIKETTVSGIESVLEELDFTQIVKQTISGKYSGLKLSDAEINSVLNSEDGNVSDNLYELMRKKDSVVTKDKNQFENIFCTLITNNIDSALSDKVPSFIIEPLIQDTANKVDECNNLIVTLIKGEEATADYFEAKYLREPLVNIVTIFTFIILFLIVLVATRFVANRLEEANSIPVLGKVNSLVGGVLGLAEGLVIVFIISLIIKLIISIGNGEMVLFNEDTIEKTKVFKQFYEISFVQD